MHPVGVEPVMQASSRRPMTECMATGMGFGICDSKLLSVAFHGPRVIIEVSQALFIGANRHDCEIFTVTALVRTTCIIRKVKENELKGQ